jgi:rSAM/selenodomain-associated transferase 1
MRAEATMDDAALLVFAKPPLAGVAKTRLIPALGAQGAARLAAALLEHTLAEASRAATGPLWLYSTARHPLLARAARRHGARRRLQRGADLGARMAQALQRACHDAPAALLLGADCPALDAVCLRRAARALRNADLVFVPALDGGFTLVGCRATAAAATSRLFAERTWSVADVMQRMREGLRDLGLRWIELDALADIDTPDDLAALPPALHDALQAELRCDGCC